MKRNHKKKSFQT